MKENPSKIHLFNAIFLILVALCFDGIQALFTLTIVAAMLSWIVSLFAAATFYVWLKLLGVSYWEGGGTRKLLSFLGCGFMEFVPIFNALPAWTLFVVLIIIFEYAQSIPVLGALGANLVGVSSFRGHRQAPSMQRFRAQGAKERFDYMPDERFNYEA